LLKRGHTRSEQLKCLVVCTSSSVSAQRVGRSEPRSWCHIQIVLNIALRMYRLPAAPRSSNGSIVTD
jgi:hypothetical protein